MKLPKWFSREPEILTILLPCKNQKREFFLDCVGSVVRQSSPRWKLLILADVGSPPELREWAASFHDARIEFVVCPGAGFAAALNHGLRIAETPFVSLLLSDDRYSRVAVETLLQCRKNSPRVDFFYSSRMHIDPEGNQWGPSMRVRPMRLADFETAGSPVKHLLCWRRDLALKIGGMDEELSRHGCDDYDFPWRMAKAGARFEAIVEVLYEYRLHEEHDRLTTSTGLVVQLETLRKMFEKHGVSAWKTDRYLQNALEYLIPEQTNQVFEPHGRITRVRLFREADSSTMPAFRDAGIRQRAWFPHRVYLLPKCGPDGAKLAGRIAGCRDTSKLGEFLVYALPPVIDEFPAALFSDDDIQWHQQQFGINGQIACASVAFEQGAMRVYTLVSDLVQRAARAPKFRTRIDKLFDGWAKILMNAILVHAEENGIPFVFVAGSEIVLRNTDKRRNPKAALYQRIYDEVPKRLGAVREGEWWRIDVTAALPFRAPLERKFEVDNWPRTICIMHDTEAGLGHRESHPGLAAEADANAGAWLREILDREAVAGVKVQYNVVATLFDDYQEAIRAGGHAMAFHSYDHRMTETPDDLLEMLWKCRAKDYRLKGYRPPQSKQIEGSEAALLDANFEWLASSARSLGHRWPVMSNGLVRIPVHLDDYALFTGQMTYGDWRDELLKLAREQDFLVIGLHDCYAPHWLPWYGELLRELQGMAALMTLDEVAARFSLGAARWFEASVGSQGQSGK